MVWEIDMLWEADFIQKGKETGKQKRTRREAIGLGLRIRRKRLLRNQLVFLIVCYILL